MMAYGLWSMYGLMVYGQSFEFQVMSSRNELAIRFELAEKSELWLAEVLS